jgi:hypothetical protein
MRKLRIENLRVATCKLAGLGAWDVCIMMGLGFGLLVILGVEKYYPKVT